jgi:hypothetical protein
VKGEITMGVGFGKFFGGNSTILFFIILFLLLFDGFGAFGVDDK